MPSRKPWSAGPRSVSSVVRFAITTSGNGNEQQIDGTSALPTGAWVHVAVTKSGNVGTLYVNDKKFAEGRIEHTQPMIFSADETADVGIDLATPVVETIGSEARSRFTGRIPKVTVEVKDMKKADQREEDKARLEFAHKKALSD